MKTDVKIIKDFEIRFDTSKYQLDRTLPKTTNQKVIRLIKYELGENRK